ncbi:MAG: gliding motility-associated C-terminal domain-containing protein [Bacteroidia bacterium]
MKNGSGLAGDVSASQGALFIAFPGNPDSLLLFTIGEAGDPQGLQYSIIDLKKQSGKGEVVQKNVPLQPGAGEQLAAYHNRDGSYWVVGHQLAGDRFFAYKISERGITGGTVISRTGPVDNDGIGNMMISPDGKHLAISFRGMHTYVLCDFDARTGIVSNAIGLGTNFHKGYGVAFSPDSRSVFVQSSEFSDINGQLIPASIFQFDISLPQAQLLASRQLVGNVGVTYPGAMQPAPNGLIYVARYGASTLGVIRNPNLRGAASNYDDLGQSTLSRTVNLGLPVFPANTIIEAPTLQIESGCVGDKISMNATGLIAIDSIRWDVFDINDNLVLRASSVPATFAANNYGMYTIHFIYYRGENADTLSQDLHIHAIPEVNLGADTAICPGTKLKLDIRQAWMDGDNTVFFSWQNGNPLPDFKIDQPGLYYVEVRNKCGIARDSIEVDVRALPHVDLGPDKLLCKGDVFRLKAGSQYPDARITWSTRAHTPQIDVRSESVVWVLVEDQCGSASDEINIKWESLPPFSLLDKQDICPDEVLTVRAGPDPSWVHYRWGDGTPGPDRAIIEAGTYIVEMKGQVCVKSDTLKVTDLAPPRPAIGNDTTLCEGERVYLSATSASASYFWNTGSTSTGFWVDEGGQYIVKVNNRCGTGRDTVDIALFQKPMVDFGNDTVICPRRPLTLDTRSDAGGLTYRWYDGSTNDVRNIHEAGTYTLELENLCGIAKDSITIRVDESTCVCQAFVPNIFTPNGDGTNDYFVVETGCNPVQYELRVFDRWGDLMFQTLNPRQYWEGQAQKGAACSEGVYFYVLSFIPQDLEQGGRQIVKGTVTLLR